LYPPQRRNARPEPKNPGDVFAAFHDQRVKVLFEPIIDAITDP
jgi:hypothetical protein